jgi:hypothetical protein
MARMMAGKMRRYQRPRLRTEGESLEVSTSWGLASNCITHGAEAAAPLKKFAWGFAKMSDPSEKLTLATMLHPRSYRGDVERADRPGYVDERQ